jgi:hypothetical protein
MSKTISRKTDPKTGRTRVLIEIEPHEAFKVIDSRAMYRMPQPLDEVVGGHHVLGVNRVQWCAAQQAWVSAE